MMIKGQTVILYTRVQTGIDAFGMPVYLDIAENVENVLVEPASNDAITSEFELNGKHVSYILHIPRNDNHDWSDSVVSFYGKKWKTYGDCIIYAEQLTPLDWGKKIKVESYE